MAAEDFREKIVYAMTMLKLASSSPRFSLGRRTLSTDRVPAWLIGLRGSRRLLPVLLLVLACATLLWPASQARAEEAQQPASEQEEIELTRRANSIARQTMSPFCPGRTLADCPSPNAALWRGDIRDMLAEGKNAQEIQREFEARTGGDLSGIPNRESSYTLTIALSLLAALVLVFVLMKIVRKRDAPKPQEKTEEESGPLAVSEERLNEELENLDP